MASTSGLPQLSYRPHKSASKEGGCLAGLNFLKAAAFDISIFPWFGCFGARIIVGTWWEEKVKGRRVFKGPNEKVCNLKAGELPDPPEDIKTERASELQDEWPSLLRDGQVWAGLILSTSYSHKYKGAKTPLGSTVPVKLPALTKEQETTWEPKLVDCAGNKEGVAFMWLGDAKYDDKTIYVAVSMMRDMRQVRQIVWSTMDLGAGDTGSDVWEKMRIGTYVRRKVDKMWDSYELGAKLEALVGNYKGYRVVFAGISHGGSLAQAAALRLKLARPDANVFCIAWNPYAWTDQEGSDQVKKIFGGKMLPVVLTHRLPWDGRRIWDPLTSTPYCMAALPDSWLLDTDTGSWSSTTKNHPSFPGKVFPDAINFRKLWRLHYASIAIVATRFAMKKSLKGPEGAQ